MAKRLRSLPAGVSPCQKGGEERKKKRRSLFKWGPQGKLSPLSKFEFRIAAANYFDQGV